MWKTSFRGRTNIVFSLCFTHLVEDFLEVGRAHAVGQVSVRRVREEELPLGSHGGGNVFLAVNVLLAPIHHADVTWTQVEIDRTARSNSFYHFLEFDSLERSQRLWLFLASGLDGAVSY